MRAKLMRMFWLLMVVSAIAIGCGDDPTQPAGNCAVVPGSTIQLTTDGGTAPVWSPSGQKIALESTRSGAQQLWVYTLAGETYTQVSTVRVSGGVGGAEAVWSPDGSAIAYVQLATQFGVYVYSLNDNTSRRISDAAANSYSPNWSPSGATIAFFSYLGEGVGIWTASSGGDSRVRITGVEREAFEPQWSPDGAKIAYVGRSSAAEPSQLWISSPDGSSAAQLTSGEGSVARFAWSPDGSRIAYTSGAGTGDEVWTVSPNGANAVQLTDDGGRKFVLSWSPDGRYLAYDLNDNGKTDIWVVSSSGGSPIRMTTSERSSAPDWSPDGSRIAFVSTGGIWTVGVDMNCGSE